MKNVQILVVLACSANALLPRVAVAETGYQATPVPGLSGSHYSEAKTWNAPPGQIGNSWQASPQATPHAETPAYWSGTGQRPEPVLLYGDTNPVDHAPILNQQRKYLGPAIDSSQPMPPPTYYPATAALPSYPAPSQPGNAPAYYGNDAQPPAGYPAPVYSDANPSPRQSNPPRTYQTP